MVPTRGGNRRYSIGYFSRCSISKSTKETCHSLRPLVNFSRVNIMYILGSTIIRNSNPNSPLPVNPSSYSIIDIGEIIPPVGIAERVCGLPLAEICAVVTEQEAIPQSFDFRLAGEEIHGEVGLFAGLEFAEGVAVDGAELFAVLDTEGVAEHVVEEHLVSGEDRIASGYGGFIYVFEIVAAQQREAVPQEGFPAVAVVGGRELTADVVAVTLRGLAVFGYLHHFVEPVVGERLFTLLDHAARRVVFVLRDLAVGILAADQLVRLVLNVIGRQASRRMEKHLPDD